MDFRRIARAEDIPLGETRLFVLDGIPIVVANRDGRFYALHGICPHQNRLLTGASLWDDLLTCPWHNYQYDIATGENCFPKRVYPVDMQSAVRGLPTYRVEVRDGQLWVAID